MPVKNPVWDSLIESPFNKILPYSSLPKVGQKKAKVGWGIFTVLLERTALNSFDRGSGHSLFKDVIGSCWNIVTSLCLKKKGKWLVLL